MPYYCCCAYETESSNIILMLNIVRSVLFLCLAVEVGSTDRGSIKSHRLQTGRQKTVTTQKPVFIFSTRINPTTLSVWERLFAVYIPENKFLIASFLSPFFHSTTHSRKFSPWWQANEILPPHYAFFISRILHGGQRRRGKKLFFADDNRLKFDNN